MDSINYTAIQGDRWDVLAYKYYGSVKSMNILTDANPTVPVSWELMPGTNLIIPIMDDTNDSIITQNLPPWMN